MEPLKTDWRRLHGDALAGRRALITGGAGFIGSHLAEALVELDAQVVAFDDLSAGSTANLRPVPSVEFVEGSIVDSDALVESTRGCCYVFHLAAIGSVPRSLEEPRRYQEVNVGGTLNVLEAARQAGVERVIFAASSSAYGSNPVPWSEAMPVLPRSPYAATKVAGECLMRAYSASYGLDTASLRYFNIFGPRQNPASAYAAVIAAFAREIVAGRRPVIYGDGEQARDFTFVHNAVHANLLAATRREPLRGEVFNVGCGASVSVNLLARRMGEILTGRPVAPEYREARRGDVMHSVADLTKCRATLSYEPVVSFEAGLEQTVQWYRQRLTENPAVRAA
jgi:nucleoside-diphosphate-sugar epimerase